MGERDLEVDFIGMWRHGTSMHHQGHLQVRRLETVTVAKSPKPPLYLGRDL